MKRFLLLSAVGFLVIGNAEAEDSKDRLDLGVGYTAYRGANIYGKYKGFFDTSTLDVNTQLAFSDKSIDVKQLFPVEKNPFLVGYAASFRDFKIVPSDSSTKNTQSAFKAICVMAFTPKSSLVSTVGVERITSKSGGMAGDTGNQLLFPLTTTYRLDERVHPQIPTEGFGYFLTTNAEVSPFSFDYVKGSVRGQVDIPLTNAFVDKLALSFKFFAGTGRGLAGDSLPITKRFFLENGSPVRGYAVNGFGYNANGIPIGGNSMVTGSIELWSPLFHNDLRAYTFIDAGFMRGNGISTSDLKTAVGVGAAWSSPIGVISVSYGQALEKNAVHTQSIGIGLGINY